jgi:hypothetical protein
MRSDLDALQENMLGLLKDVGGIAGDQVQGAACTNRKGTSRQRPSAHCPAHVVQLSLPHSSTRSIASRADFAAFLVVVLGAIFSRL